MANLILILLDYKFYKVRFFSNLNVILKKVKMRLQR